MVFWFMVYGLWFRCMKFLKITGMIPSAIRRDCSTKLFAAFHLQKPSLTNKKSPAGEAGLYDG
jgi:hypothetical protein